MSVFGLRNLRMQGGPWHGRKYLLRGDENSVAVPGITAFRYVLQKTRQLEVILAWSDEREKW